MALSNPAHKTNVARPALARSATNYPNGLPAEPIAATSVQDEGAFVDAVLELADGTAFRGISFGAEGKSVAGECVFQTGANFFRCTRSRLCACSVPAYTRAPSHIPSTYARW